MCFSSFHSASLHTCSFCFFCFVSVLVGGLLWNRLQLVQGLGFCSCSRCTRCFSHDKSTRLFLVLLDKTVCFSRRRSPAQLFRGLSCDHRLINNSGRELACEKQQQQRQVGHPTALQKTSFSTSAACTQQTARPTQTKVTTTIVGVLQQPHPQPSLLTSAVCADTSCTIFSRQALANPRSRYSFSTHNRSTMANCCPCAAGPLSKRQRP